MPTPRLTHPAALAAAAFGTLTGALVELRTALALPFRAAFWPAIASALYRQPTRV